MGESVTLKKKKIIHINDTSPKTITTTNSDHCSYTLQKNHSPIKTCTSGKTKIFSSTYKYQREKATCNFNTFLLSLTDLTDTHSCSEVIKYQ